MNKKPGSELELDLELVTRTKARPRIKTRIHPEPERDVTMCGKLILTVHFCPKEEAVWKVCKKRYEREKEAGERHQGPTRGAMAAAAAAAAADECFSGGRSARGCQRAR